MAKYLIDENLPEDFEIWQGQDFVHAYRLPHLKSDTEIWNYALKNDLIIITKDADYYHRYLVSSGGPHIIWLRIGNLRKKDFSGFIGKIWEKLKALASAKRLTIVFTDYIEAFD